MPIKRAFLIVLLVSILILSAGISYSGSGLYVYGTDGQVPASESVYVDNLVNWIATVANYGTHSPTIIYQDPSVTRDSILAAASPPDDPALVFFVGHGEYGALALHIIYLIVDNNGDIVSDNDTYALSGLRRVHFVFLHSCFQGAEIGGYFTVPSILGPIPYHYGMPQALLHTTALSSNGYESPDYSGYVFIGWRGPAPYLSADILGVNDTLYRFIGHFYDKLFGYYTTSAASIKQALDYASYTTFGNYTYFSETPLYKGFNLDNLGNTSMIVYGDGSYDNW